jgi:hypothetical protein
MSVKAHGTLAYFIFVCMSDEVILSYRTVGRPVVYSGVRGLKS